jgi:serine/threonine protein kinase
VPAVWNVGDLILDEFEVADISGQGGMGTVYKIYYRTRNIDLAVKSPRPEIFARADGKENFVHEAETWMGLGEHPYLVRCYFVRTLGGIPRVFAEYVEGGSLADWIRQRRLYEGGPEQALERMLDVAIQFAWGLHFAHEQGLVHQDVKPANVMLTRDGVAKVTDFGLAKARVMAGEQGVRNGEGHQSGLVSSRGMTLAYCSPEQAAGQALSRKTDIWSWGVSVLEMFTGEVTWSFGGAAREVLASYEGQDPTIPIMPADVVNLLNRCFQQEPETRPATMLEVATELRVIYAHSVGHSYERETPKSTEIQVRELDVRGVSLVELGRLEEALVVCEQAIRLNPIDPTHAGANMNRGAVLRKMGRYNEALAAYERCIQLNPADVDAHYNKGVALQSLGHNQKALAAYERAIQLNPTHTDAHHNKAVLLRQPGRMT